jgi:hypothetical protein
MTYIILKPNEKGSDFIYVRVTDIMDSGRLALRRTDIRQCVKLFERASYRFISTVSTCMMRQEKILIRLIAVGNFV